MSQADLIARIRLIRSQSERLVEAETLATVGVFASAVAHGIRNPLAIIRSSAELAREEEDEALRRETLDSLLREADRLDGWVRDLLLSARGDAMVAGGAAVGAVWEVYNRGANALLLYPPSGYTTDALAANAAYSIAASAARRFRAVSGTAILSSAM